MKENILVTGGNGFIGANLVRRLVKEDKYNISILARKSSNLWRIDEIKDRLEIVYADITNLPALKSSVSSIKPLHIFHLVTYGSYPGKEKDAEKMVATNTIGTFNLLKATEDIDYASFINTGTSSEYGIKDEPISEDDVLQPNDIYGASKASATLMCQAFSGKNKKNIMTIRPFSVYGPYEEDFRLIPYVIMNCLRKKDILLTKGNQKRDFIFVDDVVDMYLDLMKKNGFEGKIINAGTGTDHTIKEVAETICEITGTDKSYLKFDSKKMRDNEAIKSWKADTKILDSLGMKPKHSLKDGLKKTVGWFEKNISIYENK